MATSKKKTMRKSASVVSENKIPFATAASVGLGLVGAVVMLLSFTSLNNVILFPYIGYIGLVAGIGATFFALSGRKVNSRRDVWILGLVLGIGTFAMAGYYVLLVLYLYFFGLNFR